MKTVPLDFSKMRKCFDCKVPDNFVHVDRDDFEAYLKTCPDYLTEQNFGNGDILKFRHNDKRFAYVTTDGDVHVHPSILE